MCIEIDLRLCRNDFVSKQVQTSQIRPRLHWTHTMQCTLGSIRHGGRLTWKNVLVSYVIIVVLIKEITLLLEKNFYHMKSDWQGWRCLWWTVFQFRYFWITVTTRYRKRLLLWNSRAWYWYMYSDHDSSTLRLYTCCYLQCCQSVPNSFIKQFSK